MSKKLKIILIIITSPIWIPIVAGLWFVWPKPVSSSDILGTELPSSIKEWDYSGGASFDGSDIQGHLCGKISRKDFEKTLQELKTKGNLFKVTTLLKKYLKKDALPQNWYV